MANDLPDAPWAAPDLPDAPWASKQERPSMLAKAVEPITSYPETYSQMNREAREQMSRGVEQLGSEGAWEKTKGAANVALGGIGYAYSPIAAGLRTIVGKPVEENTGIPKEYTELAAGLATPGVGFTRLPTAAARAAVPTAAEIKAAAQAAYKSPEVSALRLTPDTLPKLGDSIASSLTTEGYHPLLAPKTHGILSEMTKVPEGQPFVTADNANTLHRMLGKASMSSDPTERAAAQIAQRSVRDFMADVPKGSVIAGDADAASAVMQEARGNYAASMRSERIAAAEKKAERQAAKSWIGSNTENARRQRIAEILDSKTKSRGFSSAEKAAMDDYVKGSITRNSLRVATKVLGGDNAGMAAIHASLAYPTSGASLALPATGFVLKKIGDNLSRRQLQRIDELIRSRSPLAEAVESSAQNYSQAGQKFALDPSDKNIARFLVASNALGNRLRSAGVSVDPARLRDPFHLPGTGRADQDQPSVPRPPAQEQNGGRIGKKYGFAHGGDVGATEDEIQAEGAGFSDRFGDWPDADAFEAAARRTREAARPPGGRYERAVVSPEKSELLRHIEDTIKFPGEVMKGVQPEVPGQWSEADQFRADQRNADMSRWASPTAFGMVFDPLAVAPKAIPRGALGSFAGRGAKTADHSALAKAEEMAAKGATPEHVWDETGWFQGADKKWRFEIPDNKSFAMSGKPGKMGEKLSHDDLYRAYPELSQIKTRYDMPASNAELQYNRWTGDESIGLPRTESFDTTRAGYSPELRNLLEHSNLHEERRLSLHELQHAIQNREGFTPGGNPNELMLIAEKIGSQHPGSRPPKEIAYEAYRRLAGEVEARNVQHRANWDNDKLRQTPPWRTEDVVPEKQTVLPSDEGSFTAMSKGVVGSGVTPKGASAAGDKARDAIEQFRATMGDRSTFNAFAPKLSTLSTAQLRDLAEEIVGHRFRSQKTKGELVRGLKAFQRRHELDEHQRMLQD